MNSMQKFIGLKSVDFFIRRELGKANASPFVAHVDLGASDQDKVAKGLQEFVGGRPEKIALALDRFPAAASWYLAVNLAQNYRSGADNNAPTSAIYPHIEKAFRTQPIVYALRFTLALAFRRAANKLGLVLSPPDSNFYSDAYVCQAGIAKSQLPALTRAFLKAEAVYGSPPDEDTQRLNMWEVRAAQTFAHGLTRLQNIMVWDDTAYHAGVFARVRRNDVAGPLSQAMAEAIGEIQASGGVKGISLEERPRLALVDGAPALIAPGHCAIEASCNGRGRSVAAGRSWELPAPWCGYITVTEPDAEGNGDGSFEMAFLPSLESIVIFDADSGVMLGQISSDGASLAVDAREVAIASRTRISSEHLQSQQLGSEAHVLFLETGTAQRLIVGGCEYTLTPPARPRILLDADRLLPGSGGGLFCHPRALIVTFPDEVPDKAILTINHPAMNEPINLPIAESGRVDLQNILPRFGPAGPLATSVTIGDGGRPLIRSSQWVWPGLHGLDGFAFDGPIPENFVQEKSEFVAVGDDRLGLEASATWRNARIAFQHRDRVTSYTIPRPGMSVSLVDDYGRERPHQLGNRITISPGSHERLVIRTDDPAAILVIRGNREESSFGSSGVRRLSLSALDGKGVDNRIQYLPQGDPRQVLTIAELSLSTEPADFLIERDQRRQCLNVKTEFNGLIDAVRLNLTDFENQEDQEWTAPLGRMPASGSQTPLFWGSAEYGPHGSHTSSLQLHIDDRLFDGCRLGELSFRLEGEERFRELRNLRGDSYLFLAGDRPAFESSRAYLTACEVLNRCVARETWHTMKPIVGAWTAAGFDLTVQERHDILLRGWGRPLPPGQSSSWVPLRHPIEIDPELLSVDPIHFHALGDEGDGTNELAALHRLAVADRVRDAATALLVEPTFFLGFANWQDAERRSVPLRDFSLKALMTVRNLMPPDLRPSSSWRPTDGRLTDRHHEWCVEHFIDRFEMAMPNPEANAERMVRLNRMINIIARDHRDRGIPVSEQLVDRCQIASGIAVFISSACQAWRKKTFPALLAELSHRADAPQALILEDLGLLLRLAPELTAFYLLLWELVCMTERRTG